MKALLKYLFIFLSLKHAYLENPFSALGIPTLNPSEIFNPNEGKSQSNINNLKNINNIPKIKTVDDLQKFLKQGNFDELQGLTIVSKFLIADDYILKRNGVVFDLTGYDALSSSEIIYPEGSKEKLLQRAKSAAKIFFSNTFKDNNYEAMGAEDITKFNGKWRIYKVLLAGKNSYDDHMFLKVCLPMDESLTPIVSNFNDDCMTKIQLVEETRMKNLPYLNKIKNSNVFRKMPIQKKLIKTNNKGEQYNNLLKNYNNFIQNQNSIQTPPSMGNAQNNNPNNILNQMALNNNSNMINQNLNTINNINSSQLLANQNVDLTNFMKNKGLLSPNNINLNNSYKSNLQEKVNKMNDEADKKGNTDLDIFSFRENKSFSLPQISNSDKVSEENGTKSKKENNNINNSQNSESTNTQDNQNFALPNQNQDITKENINGNLTNNEANKSSEINNQIYNKLNTLNLSQQQQQQLILQQINPFQSQQGIQNPQQINPQTNNFLTNQPNLYNNPLTVQQMSVNSQKNKNNLRGLEKQNNSKSNPILQNATELANISTSNRSPIPNISQESMIPLINRINVLETQLKNEQIFNQAIKNEFVILKKNAKLNFKKLQDAVNQLAVLIKNKA